jgi:hypothetical protein
MVQQAVCWCERREEERRKEVKRGEKVLKEDGAGPPISISAYP